MSEPISVVPSTSHWCNFMSCFRTNEEANKDVSGSSNVSSSSRALKESEESPKWNAFKAVMPSSGSEAIAQLAADWKNQYAEKTWTESYIMKPVTWIATPALSAFAAVLSPFEGVVRACTSLVLSLLATISPWGTDKINEFNDKYFNNTLVRHIITARVAAEHAFTGPFTPNTNLASFDEIVFNSNFCNIINPKAPTKPASLSLPADLNDRLVAVEGTLNDTGWVQNNLTTLNQRVTNVQTQLGTLNNNNMRSTLHELTMQVRALGTRMAAAEDGLASKADRSLTPEQVSSVPTTQFPTHHQTDAEDSDASNPGTLPSSTKVEANQSGASSW